MSSFVRRNKPKLTGLLQFEALLLVLFGVVSFYTWTMSWYWVGLWVVLLGSIGLIWLAVIIVQDLTRRNPHRDEEFHDYS